MWQWLKKTSKPGIPDTSRLLRQYPELALFDNPEDRANAWIEATRAARRGMGIWTVLLCIVLIIGSSLIANFLGRHVPPAVWDWMKHCFGSGTMYPILVLSGLLVLRLRRRCIERSLREQLVRHGRPICINCGYDLQGMTGPCCPLCKAPFDPTLLEHTNPAAAIGES